jgi:hypothetical protein
VKKILLLVWILFAEQSLAVIWIYLDNKFSKLKEHTTCKNYAFAGAECDCCLIIKTKIHKLSIEDAAVFCRAEQSCSNIDSPDLSINILRPFEIIDINKNLVAHKLPKIDHLNLETIPHLLEFSSEQRFLPTLSSEPLKRDCFKASMLKEAVKGVNTGELFALSLKAKCLNKNDAEDKWLELFILKETTKGLAELQNLFRVRSSNLENEYISTAQMINNDLNSKKSGFHIAFDEFNFKINTSGKSRYYSILQKARGKSIHTHLFELGLKLKDSSLSKNEKEIYTNNVKEIFYNVGSALSTLHQKYAFPTDESMILRKTYTHGDCHAQNIFYDENSKIVSLIDNETFALSQKKPHSGINDLVDFYLLHTANTVAHIFAPQLWTNDEFGINDFIWHELWRHLFLAYIDAFNFNDVNKRKIEVDKFRQAFMKSLLK